MADLFPPLPPPVHGPKYELSPDAAWSDWNRRYRGDTWHKDKNTAWHGAAVDRKRQFLSDRKTAAHTEHPGRYAQGPPMVRVNEANADFKDGDGRLYRLDRSTAPARANMPVWCTSSRHTKSPFQAVYRVGDPIALTAMHELATQIGGVGVVTARIGDIGRYTGRSRNGYSGKLHLDFSQTAVTDEVLSLQSAVPQPRAPKRARDAAAAVEVEATPKKQRQRDDAQPTSPDDDGRAD